MTAKDQAIIDILKCTNQNDFECILITQLLPSLSIDERFNVSEIFQYKELKRLYCNNLLLMIIATQDEDKAEVLCKEKGINQFVIYKKKQVMYKNIKL